MANSRASRRTTRQRISNGRHTRVSACSDVESQRRRRRRDHLKDLRARRRSRARRELALVAAQDWAKQLLLNFHRISYLSSTGFAVLFKLFSQFKARGGELKLCNLDPGIRLGAEIVGLDKLVEIYDSEAKAPCELRRN